MNVFGFIKRAWATASLDGDAFRADVDKTLHHLARGGDPNYLHSPHGFAPLHRVCQPNSPEPRIEIARLLLEHGVQIGIRSAQGQTPLHVAALMGCRELASFFLERGADVNATDSMGYTPFHAAAAGGDIGLAQLLLDHGADAGVLTSNGKTAADVAKEEGYPAMEDFLRKRGT